MTDERAKTEITDLSDIPMTEIEITEPQMDAGYRLTGARGNGTDLRRTGKLLDEMKRYSTPVQPRLLGAIGHAHLYAHIKAAGATKESIEYKSAAFFHDGIPYLVEAAFGYCPKGREERSFVRRKIIAGINNSVAIGDPFRNISVAENEYEQSLGEILTDLKAGQQEPIIFVLHVICPRIDYLDRGKSAVSLPDMPCGEIVRLVTGVTRKWTKQRKAEERDASARLRRDDAMAGLTRMNQKEAAAEVLEAAYMKASDNGQLPAKARQIYYTARPLMLELTGKSVLNYNYFSQTLLVDFMAENPEQCGKWDVVWDDRGHFEEPQGGGVIGLGTLSVREYLDGNHDLEMEGAGFKDVKIKTHGAHGRFGAQLFVEKEGFSDLFKSVRLADRYDIGIMSSKGVSVTAARQLADNICSEHDIPLLTLHDFDIYGFTIGRIGEDTRRYTFENKIDVINIGLRLDDILELDGVNIDDLAEPCEPRGDKREELEESGCTEDEINFLLGDGEFAGAGARRIELNALTSRQLVDLIERRLREHGAGKIVPGIDDLGEAFRHYARAPKIKEAIEKAIADMPGDAVEVPAGLEEQVKVYLEEHPEYPWEKAVAEIVKRTK